MARAKPQKRTGAGTARPCPKLSAAEKDRLVAAIMRQESNDVHAPWRDPTKGRVSERRGLYSKCGASAFACPNAGSPAYPIVTDDCSPRCLGVSAAEAYARKYGAHQVLDNLRELEGACIKRRRQLSKKSSKKSSKKKSSRRAKRSSKRSSRRSARRTSRRTSRRSRR